MKILLFSPFANIWEHSFPEALIAEGLAERGSEIIVVRCGTMLQPHCVAMSAAGVTADAPLATRQRVCSACIKRRDLLDRVMPFRQVVLDDLISEDDRTAARAAVDAVTPDTWESYELNGAALGRYAAYEFLLDNKVLGTDVPSELWPQYEAKLDQSVTTFLAGRRLLQAEVPDRVIVYNRLYAANHAFCMAAGQVGIPSYTLQGGGHIVRRGETMTMFRDTESLDDVFRTEAWARYRSAPIGAAEVDLVAEHLAGLLEGSSAFAYSSAFEASQPAALRERFGVPEGAQVALVPMSSEDEINAARLADVLPERSDVTSLFADQFEWIAHLFEIAEERPDLHFIIRLHPRMFPNKRESVLSPVVARIMALVEERPSNVTLNLPTDDVSLYDLMQIVDVLLSFRSSAGVELTAFGLPVVIPSNRDFFTYPADLNYVGTSRAEYLALIDRALEEGWSIEHTRRAFRWFAFLFSRVATDLSESVHSRPIAIRPKKPGLRLRLWRAMVWIALQYGPLVRERLSLRGRRLSATSGDVITDVLEAGRGSLAESSAWSSDPADSDRETRLLEGYLRGLCDVEWKDVRDEQSLAGRIRAHLSGIEARG